MLPAEHPLSHRIQELYPKLTRGQQRVARVLLEAPHEAAFMSAAELGRRVAVSDSTVVRLPTVLGYAGYPELRQELQEALAARMAPVELLRQRLEANPGPASTLALEIESLRSLEAGLETGWVERAVELLLEAQRIFVIGHRSWFGVAHLCSHLLQQMLGNAELLAALGGSLPDQLAELGPDGALVAFSTPRYSRQVLQVARYASRSGCRVVAVTDSVLSPLAAVATLAVTIPIQGTSFFPSTIAGQAVVNLLASEVARRRRAQATGRLEAVDRVVDELRLLLTEHGDG
jgi:DNA-binding MurR/RpiR family transcriptional regulator